MSDTPRTLDYFINEGSGVFADNASNAITVQNLRDLVRTASSGFGGIWGSGGTLALTTDYADYDTVLDEDSAFNSDDITTYPQPGSCMLEVSVTGTYLVFFNASGSLNDVAGLYGKLCIYEGYPGYSDISPEIAISPSGAGDVATLSLVTITSLAAGKQVVARMKAGASRTWTNEFSFFGLIRVG